MVYCLLIPFIGTVIGSLFIYIMSKKINRNMEIIVLGFAAGVMMAASIWSLIMPSLDMGNVYKASIGLLIGIIFFYLLDIYVVDKNIFNFDKIMFAITIHNIPEGMAVGVLLASYKLGNISLIPCLALSMGIGIQNIPEGFIVSLTRYKNDNNKNKAFIYGVISALFELIGGIITLLFVNIINVLLPFLLAIAAGAMIYVIILELIPESNSNNKLNVIAFIVGFIIMMILDVIL